jgi:iron complex transport system substrate-binding protein
VKKPAHQWETRLHQAYRLERPSTPGFAQDSRAEAFELRFHDGRVGHAVLGLARQEGCPTAVADPDFLHAVRAWLCARGQRQAHIVVRDGQAEYMLDQGSFTPAELGTPSTLAMPQRIITLCPSNAELVHALDCFERVIACEDSSDYPPEVAERERLGPDLGPDLERVRALAPDLVISSLTVPGMERVVTGLRARGLAQLVLAPRSLADVLEECVLAAQQLAVPERGQALRARLEQEIAELERALPERPQRVYLEWWPKPMFTPGSACYSNELIRLAGGSNVFAERPGSSVEITDQDLLAADPDACFVSWCGVALDKLDPEHLRKRPGLASLRAAQEGHVFPLDEAFSGRPGPRMLEAARVMAAFLRGMSRDAAKSVASDS